MGRERLEQFGRDIFLHVPGARTPVRQDPRPYTELLSDIAYQRFLRLPAQRTGQVMQALEEPLHHKEHNYRNLQQCNHPISLCNWKCRNCGHIHEGLEAPEGCPVCAHPKAYFEVQSDNY